MASVRGNSPALLCRQRVRLPASRCRSIPCHTLRNTSEQGTLWKGVPFLRGRCNCRRWAWVSFCAVRTRVLKCTAPRSNPSATSVSTQVVFLFQKKVETVARGHFGDDRGAETLGRAGSKAGGKGFPTRLKCAGHRSLLSQNLTSGEISNLQITSKEPWNVVGHLLNTRAFWPRPG